MWCIEMVFIQGVTNTPYSCHAYALSITYSSNAAPGQTNDYLHRGTGPHGSASRPANGGFNMWLFLFALVTQPASAFVHVCGGVGHLPVVQFMPLGGTLRMMGAAGKDP